MSREETEIIPIEAIVSETEKAYLIRLKEGSDISEHWFPKSQCWVTPDKKYIAAPTWLLDTKGII